MDKAIQKTRLSVYIKETIKGLRGDIDNSLNTGIDKHLKDGKPIAAQSVKVAAANTFILSEIVSKLEEGNYEAAAEICDALVNTIGRDRIAVAERIRQGY